MLKISILFLLVLSSVQCKELSLQHAPPCLRGFLQVGDCSNNIHLTLSRWKQLFSHC